MRWELLGSPHSGQSIICPDGAFSTSGAWTAWTVASPPQVQPAWPSVQRAVSLAMACLQG
jgi:hypothetical protein